VPPGQLNTKGKGGGGSEPSTSTVESFQYYFHPDHLGSTSYITDASGEVYQHLEYFAFGETFVEEHSNTNRTPFLYNGKELDDETGLYYYGVRYYDARTSVWLAVDPLAEEFPNLSPYVYCFNNPLRFIDPEGLSPTPEEGAEMAEHVYKGKVGDKLSGGWKMIEVYEDKTGDNPGYRAGLYQRKNDDGKFEYVMANAGTADLDDASENVEQPFGGSEHMQLSIQKARQLNDKYKNSQLTFVGHSKGGAEAAGNALATNRDALLYNPAAIVSSAYGLNSDDYTANMTAYVVRGEILHSQLNWWFARPIDKLVMLPRQHGSFFEMGPSSTVNQVRNHFMSSVMSALKQHYKK
jgi:RHS repeat-associated protein